MNGKVWAGVAVAIAIFGALMYFAITGQTATSCEACVEFNGQTKCRTAKGPTKEEALKTATDNACAFLASGMTDSIKCGRTPPKSSKCE